MNPADFKWSVRPHGNGNASVTADCRDKLIVVAKCMPEWFAHRLASTHNQASSARPL
jgi:hypothetical protein